MVDGNEQSVLLWNLMIPYPVDGGCASPDSGCRVFIVLFSFFLIFSHFFLTLLFSLIVHVLLSLILAEVMFCQEVSHLSYDSARV